MNKISKFQNKAQCILTYNDENFQLITSLEFYKYDMFKNQRIFIYNENSLNNEKLQNILLKLKADVIHSFDDKVNYVITSNKKVKDETKCYKEESKFSKNKPKFTETNSKPIVSIYGLRNRNRICSIVKESKNINNIGSNNKPVDTRLEDQSGFLLKVKNLGIKVLSINDVWRWLLETYPLLFVEDDEVIEENTSFDAKKKIQQIKTPAIKIFDKLGRYKPEYKPLSNFNPGMWEETCSFNIKKDEELVEKEIETKNDSCVTKSKLVRGLSRCHTVRPSDNVKLPKLLNEGYCECCDSKFKDVKAHLESFQHVKFVDDIRNFASIDEVLKEFVNFDEFFKVRIRKQLALERMANRRLIKQLSVNDFKKENIKSIKENQTKETERITPVTATEDSLASLRSAKSENCTDILITSLTKTIENKEEIVIERSAGVNKTFVASENENVKKSLEFDLLKKLEVDLENQRKQFIQDCDTVKINQQSLSLSRLCIGKLEEIMEEECIKINNILYYQSDVFILSVQESQNHNIIWQSFKVSTTISVMEFASVTSLESIVYVNGSQFIYEIPYSLINADQVISTRPLFCCCLKVVQDLSEACCSIVVPNPIPFLSKVCSNYVLQASTVTNTNSHKSDILSQISAIKPVTYDRASLSSKHHDKNEIQSFYPQFHQCEVVAQQNSFYESSDKDNDISFVEPSILDESVGSSIERPSLIHFNIRPESFPDDSEEPLSPVVSNSKYHVFSPFILRSIDKNSKEVNFTPSYNYSPDRYKNHFTDFNYDFMTTSPSNNHINDVILSSSDFISPENYGSKNCPKTFSVPPPPSPPPPPPPSFMDEAGEDCIINLRTFLKSSETNCPDYLFNVLSDRKISQKNSTSFVSIDSIVQNHFQNRFNLNLSSFREVTNISKVQKRSFDIRLGKRRKPENSSPTNSFQNFPIKSPIRKKSRKESSSVKKHSNISQNYVQEFSPVTHRPFRQAKWLARESIQIATDLYLN